MSNASAIEAPLYREVPEQREAAGHRAGDREKGETAWHVWVLEAYPDLG